MVPVAVHGGVVDVGSYAAHRHPAGTPQHVREALWAFSGWVPVAAVVECVALTTHAAAEIMRKVPPRCLKSAPPEASVGPGVSMSLALALPQPLRLEEEVCSFRQL